MARSNFQHQRGDLRALYLVTSRDELTHATLVATVCVLGAASLRAVEEEMMRSLDRQLRYQKKPHRKKALDADFAAYQRERDWAETRVRAVFDTMTQCDAFLAMATKDYGAVDALARQRRNDVQVDAFCRELASE